MAHEVFISHAARDREVAEAVCRALEEHEAGCWIAPRDVLPGSEYAEAIVDALASAKVLVLVLSSAANESAHVRREVERAASRNLPIVPLRIEPVLPSKSLELFVSQHHWLDAHSGPVEEQMGKLVAAVKSHLGSIPEERTSRDPTKVTRQRTLDDPRLAPANKRKPLGDEGEKSVPFHWFPTSWKTIVLATLALGFLSVAADLLGIAQFMKDWLDPDETRLEVEFDWAREGEWTALAPEAGGIPLGSWVRIRTNVKERPFYVMRNDPEISIDAWQDEDMEAGSKMYPVSRTPSATFIALRPEEPFTPEQLHDLEEAVRNLGEEPDAVVSEQFLWCCHGSRYAPPDRRGIGTPPATLPMTWKRSLEKLLHGLVQGQFCGRSVPTLQE